MKIVKNRSVCILNSHTHTHTHMQKQTNKQTTNKQQTVNKKTFTLNMIKPYKKLKRQSKEKIRERYSMYTHKRNWKNGWR